MTSSRPQETLVTGNILVFTFAVALVGSSAFAQSLPQAPAPSRHVFLEAAVAADCDHTDFSSAGPALAVGAGITADISRRYGVRVEVEMPGWHRDDDSGVGTHAAYEHHWATRTRTLAVMVARHMGTRRRITLMAGFSVMAHDTRFSGFWDDLGAGGAVVRHTPLNDRYTEYRAAFSLGVDAPLRLTSSLALVPQIRIHTRLANELGDLFPSRAFRPRVALRWKF